MEDSFDVSNISESLKDMQLKKALFHESVDPGEDEKLQISSWQTRLSVRKSLSCGDVRDEDFYPPEVGMAMILGSQPQEVQAVNVFENVTSCSSWAIHSQHYHPESLTRTAINQQCQELFGNLSKRGSPEFKASTPKAKRTVFPKTPTLSMKKDTILKTSREDHQVGFLRRDSSLWPMLLQGATSSPSLYVPGIYGARKKQNTTKEANKTLEAEEIAKDPFQEYSGSKGISKIQSLFDFHRCDDTTLRTSVKNNAQSLCDKDDLWIVKPQALTLDASGKGRLLLVNKSSNQNLKFKILFDGKLINVCPRSGNLRSKSEIGLRVHVSRCLKENSNEVMEDIVRITCGNIEKRVPITICKTQKRMPMRNRSFKLF